MNNNNKDVDWASVRADYENGLSLRTLASKYGVSKSVIGQHKYDEQWQKFERVGSDSRTSHDNPKGNTPIVKRDINAAVRVQDAIKIYLEERPSWDEIAARCGFSSRGAAHNAVQRELDRCITHSVAELRNEELLMISNLEARCYREGMDKHNDNWTWVADRFEKLSKRRSELMGLDAKPDTVPDGTTIIREYGVEVGKV